MTRGPATVPQYLQPATAYYSTLTHVLWSMRTLSKKSRVGELGTAALEASCAIIIICILPNGMGKILLQTCPLLKSRDKIINKFVFMGM